MTIAPPRGGVDRTDHVDQVRETIPHFIRAGVLRRLDLPDGAVAFVETQTDRVFATFDRRGRLVA